MKSLGQIILEEEKSKIKKENEVFLNKKLKEYGVESISDIVDEDVRRKFLSELEKGSVEIQEDMAEEIEDEEVEMGKPKSSENEEDVEEEEVEEEYEDEEVEEGNAFSAARAKAIAKGEKTFKVGDEEYDVEDVDAEDKENAKEFVGEAGDVKLMKRKLDSIVGSPLKKIIAELVKKGFSKEEIEKYMSMMVADKVDETLSEGKNEESEK